MEEGIKFSLLYLERSKPVRDGECFRNRLSAYYAQYLRRYHEDSIVSKIQLEVGTKIHFVPMVGLDMDRFFTKNELSNVLDSITIIFRVLTSADQLNRTQSANGWKDFVARVFKEENLGYQVDPKGGVHYYVDEEFERNRFSTLSLLNSPEYGGIRAAYEGAYRYMDSTPTDNKAAVRSIFEAIEILVKQMVKTDNLNRWAVENILKQKCLPLFEGDKTSQKVVSGLFDGFALWVDSLHNYRHGQPDDVPIVPTEDVSIYILSSGSAFLRWLIGIDKRLRT